MGVIIASGGHAMVFGQMTRESAQKLFATMMVSRKKWEDEGKPWSGRDA